MEYTTTPDDDSSWITATMSEDTTANTFTIPANGKLYLRGVNNNGWGNFNYYNTITCNGNHNVGGNIMSLLYGTEFINKTSFPTTNGYILKGCYQGMFNGCSSLNYIKADFTYHTYYDYIFTNWVNGVADEGTFVMNSNANYYPEDVRGVNGIPENWNVVTE